MASLRYNIPASVSLPIFLSLFLFLSFFASFFLFFLQQLLSKPTANPINLNSTTALITQNPDSRSLHFCQCSNFPTFKKKREKKEYMHRDCLILRLHAYPATYERAIPKFLALDGPEETCFHYWRRVIRKLSTLSFDRTCLRQRAGWMGSGLSLRHSCLGHTPHPVEFHIVARYSG